MDFSEKFYRDACIPAKKLKNISQYGEALADQFPKFNTQKAISSPAEMRLDMNSKTNFLTKLLGQRLAITVNAKLQNGNLMLKFGNGNFVSKFVFIILSPLVMGGGIVSFIFGVINLLSSGLAKMMNQSPLKYIIPGLILILLGIFASAIIIGNIVGLVKQVKLGKKLTQASEKIIESELYNNYDAIDSEGNYESEYEQETDAEEQGTATEEKGNTNPVFNMGDNYLKRAFIFLEDGAFDKADEYCEKALDYMPECAEAYLGKLMAEYKINLKEDVAAFARKNDVKGSNNYKRFLLYANETELWTLIETGTCPNCGSPVNAEMDFCAVCGQKLEW